MHTLIDENVLGGKRLLRKVVAGTLGCALAAGAYANPTGMQVVAGQVSTVASGNSLLITNSTAGVSAANCGTCESARNRVNGAYRSVSSR